MQGHAFDKDTYTAKVKETSKRWKQMTTDEKLKFEIEAQHQQQLLDHLESKPLGQKQKQHDSDTLEDQVWTNAKKNGLAGGWTSTRSTSKSILFGICPRSWVIVSWFQIGKLPKGFEGFLFLSIFSVA